MELGLDLNSSYCQREGGKEGRVGAHHSAGTCDKSMGAAMKSDEIGTVGFSQYPFSDKTKVLEIFTLSFLRS